MVEHGRRRSGARRVPPGLGIEHGAAGGGVRIGRRARDREGRVNAGQRHLVVAVVISWNGVRDTLACLTSLRRAEYRPFEVVLVDNGSRDGTVDAVRRYFPEVH